MWKEKEEWFRLCWEEKEKRAIPVEEKEELEKKAKNKNIIFDGAEKLENDKIIFFKIW